MNADSEDLFLSQDKSIDIKTLPLAARMRPKSLDEYAGQGHIIGQGKLLRRAIESDRLTSLILYGPPGSGKTSLAYCISSVTKSEFTAVNATVSNVEELRKIILKAKHLKASSGRKTILLLTKSTVLTRPSRMSCSRMWRKITSS